MPAVNEIHDDLLVLVENDFGPLSEVGNQIAKRNHQIWAEAGKNGTPPPTNWDNASSVQRHDIEYRLILSWMQHRARLIPSRQRTALISDRAKRDSIQFPIIYKIIDEVCNSGDVSPYLSRGLFKNKGWNHSLDPLFSAFQMCHFHLGEFFVNPKVAIGTKNLLFGIVTRDQFKIIGVFDHNFGAEELLNEWIKQFPSDFLHLGTSEPRQSYNFKEIRKLVKNGVAVLFNINGKVCMPKSLGVMSSGHATRIANYHMYLRRRVSGVINVKGPVAIIPKRIGISYRSSGEFDIIEKEFLHTYFSMKAID